MKTVRQAGVSLLLVFCWLTPPSFGQGLPFAAPEEVGLSSRRLDRIVTVMEDQVKRNRIAGAVTLVARRGKVAHLEAHGMMDIETAKPMQEDALFRIASMTKPVTCVAVMILYEEGRFLLNDPISKYIPEFGNQRVLVPPSSEESSSKPRSTVPADREITIRHLLNHTSGLSYGSGPHAKIYQEAGLQDITSRPGATIGEAVRKLAGLPLLHHPGESFVYSLADDVLGYFVEVVSGMPLDEFLQKRILKPLDMKDTGFYVPREDLPRLATYYRLRAQGGLEKMETSPMETASPDLQTFFSGGQGLYSTASDYARFCQMMLNGGELDGVRLLSRKTVELMTTNSIGDLYSAFRSTSGDKYGFGVGIRTERGQHDEIESIGTYMWDGGTRTRFWVDPSEELIGIFMAQLRTRGWALQQRYRVLVYQAIVD
jgi:CubicO group peptidase (beta-lactamase class C family)